MTVTIEQAEGSDDAPFVPSEEWIEAFEAQTNDELYERLKRFAGLRGRMVAHSGKHVDQFYVEELVQDALDDTFLGVLRWDPSRCSLELHLRGAIKSRSRHHFNHATDYRHARIDPETGSRGTMAEIESSLASDADARQAVSAITDEVLEQLRVLAGRDVEVVQLVDVYKARVWKKVDVMEETGWSSKRYEAVRKRLIRLVKQLPTEVRDTLKVRA
jgi:hypothetical protein